MRLEWNRDGEKLYEAGVDRGVLYPLGGDGVPWNGLISVEEKDSGGQTEALRYDGIKYFDLVGGEDYQAVVTAYTYPDEFEECDGTRALVDGLLVTRQPRKPFGLCYRTMIGNDLVGEDYAYKIHLVYNATAAPSTKMNKTHTGTPEPLNFSWTIDAVPPRSTEFKPTAHIIIDSRTIPVDKMIEIEEHLYGNEEYNPYLPDQETVKAILSSPDPVANGGTPMAPGQEVLDGGTPYSTLTP